MPMPMFNARARPRPHARDVPPQGHYVCPLYKTVVRKGILSSLGQSTNFITAIELPSALPTSFWIQQGAALVCALSD